MEGLYHSMTKMVHKIKDPVKKTNKSKSIPNLLHLPTGGSECNTAQSRSRSFSNIPDGSIETETQKSGVQSLIKPDGMHRKDLKSKRQNLTDKSLYHDQIHVYENDMSTQKIKKKKKIPPKRPPPPKFSFDGNVYANLFRSTSESQIKDSVYANYEKEKLDTKIYRSDEDVSLYVNQFQDARGATVVTVDEMYIFMSDDVDFDDSGYVMMSRDRSMTS